MTAAQRGHFSRALPSLDVVARIICACVALVSAGAGRAQVHTDSSLGHAAQALSGPNYVIPQSLGLLSGPNLFQSFSTFNLASGEAAYFTTSSAGIANIISRVTGGTASLLDGNINVYAASGAPNFFFINPAGVTFGNGASINVPAGFHISTASYLKFPDGRLYSDTAHVSTFSALTPEAFGFLGNSRATITVGDGSTLFQAGAPVSVVAGDVVVNDGAIGTFGAGDVRVAAVGMDAVEVPFTGPLPVGHGTLQVDNSAVVFTTATGQNGGNVLVSAGNITIDSQGSPYFTGIYSDAPSGSTSNAGSVQVRTAGALSLVNAGAITVTTESIGNVAGLTLNVGGALSLLNGAQIYSSTSSSGNSGPVEITASGPVTLGTQSAIFSTTGGAGVSGALQVAASGPLSLSGSSQIFSAAFDTGNASDVRVSAGALALDGSGPKPHAGIYSFASSGSGNAGDVDVSSSGSISVANGAFISANSYTGGSAGNVDVAAAGNLSITNTSLIGADALSSGAAGSVALSAANITMTGVSGATTGVASDSQTAQSGSAGNISVTTPGLLTIQNGASITSTTGSIHNAGSIEVDAGSIYMTAGQSGVETGIATNALFALGGGGSIDIVVAGNMTVRDGAQVSSDSDFSFGNSGTVRINAGSLTLDGAGTYAQIASDMSSLNPAGKGGDVLIDVAGPLTLLGGGSISADTFAYGSGGAVNVRAGSITLNGQDLLVGATITSSSRSHLAGANAGTVVVTSPGTILLEANGEISSDSDYEGHAGTVNVAAANIEITGFLSTINAEALSGTAQPGNVTVDASNSLSISDLAEISIASNANLPDPGAAVPTLLKISAPDIMLSHGGLISAIALGNAPASDVLIDFGNELILDPSAISTQSFNGNGGSITIEGGELLELNHSHITTSVSGTSGNGGDIAIKSSILLIDSGSIQANTTAAKASGGDVSIDVDALVPSGSSLFVGGNTSYSFLPDVFGFNVIQAAAPSGLSGTIQISNPALDLSNSLSVLAEKLLVDTGLGRDRCHGVAGSSLSAGGRGGFAPSARELARAGEPEPAPPKVMLKDGQLELAALSGDCVH